MRQAAQTAQAHVGLAPTTPTDLGCLAMHNHKVALWAGASGGASETPVGLLPSLRWARGQGWGYRIMTPQEGGPAPCGGICTLPLQLSQGGDDLTQSSSSPAGAPAPPPRPHSCLQHPFVPISKTPVSHVPLSSAPSSSRALGGPRPIG